MSGGRQFGSTYGGERVRVSFVAVCTFRTRFEPVALSLDAAGHYSADIDDVSSCRGAGSPELLDAADSATCQDANRRTNGGNHLIHLAIFAKYWQAGYVKTRLARSVGDRLARDVYLVLLQHLVDRFKEFGDLRTVVFSPPEAQRQFREFLPDAWHVQQQVNGDLGHRLQAFLTDQLKTRDSIMIVIGSDTPDLPTSYLDRAVDMLCQYPVVLGPSQDGGYYLIGMNRLVPNLFDGIAWSTNKVLQQTMDRLHQQCCPFGLLPTLNDVDDLADLRALMCKLKKNDRDALEDDLMRKLDQLELPDV